MKRKSIKELIEYKFYSIIEKSLGYFVLFLFIITIIFVFLLSLPVYLFNNSNAFEYIWENYATVINAWWPSFGDVTDMSILISRSIIAIFGLFFTSILIGTVGEYISNKINIIRSGRTNVLENDHIVIMGYDETNHTLLNEIISSLDAKGTILIIDNKPKEEIESNIKTNVAVPKRINIILRTMDLWDIESLRKCSLQNSKQIVITPISDIVTLKTIMALKKILNEFPNAKTHISSAVYDEQNLIHFSSNKDVMFNVNKLAARVISMSNNKSGISDVYNEVLSFEGNEFYINHLSNTTNKNFIYLLVNAINIIPIGIFRNGNYLLFPSYDEVILNNDEIIYFSEKRESSIIYKNKIEHDKIIQIENEQDKDSLINNNIVIFGESNKINDLIGNLDKNIKKVLLVVNNKDRIKEYFSLDDLLEIKDLSVVENTNNISFYKNILIEYGHVIVLNNDYIEHEDSDIRNMLLYLKLIKLREQIHCNNNITIELFSNQNRLLISQIKGCDLIVSTNLTSMMLAQMSESPRMNPIFMEILSCNGLKLDLKSFDEFFDKSIICISDAIKYLYSKGYIVLGVMKKDSSGNRFIKSILDFTVVSKNDELAILCKG